jgi:hypothetical protein
MTWVGALLLGIPAPSQTAGCWDPGLRMEGPGDLEAEQALWSEVELPQLEAPLAIVLNHRTFALERLP